MNLITIADETPVTSLREVAVDLITNEECINFYKGRFDLPTEIVCALTDGKDACQVKTSL